MQLIHRVRYLKFLHKLTTTYSSFVQCFNTKTLVFKTPFEVDSYRTYQEMVYFYLCEKPYWKTVVNKLIASQNDSDFKDINNYFRNRTSSYSPTMKKSGNTTLPKLPSYIAAMKNHLVYNQTVTICDAFCAEIFDLNFSTSRISSFEFIHGWLYYFHPQFINLPNLTCFGKLLQWRCREVLSNTNHADEFLEQLVHLTFLAGIGRRSFDTHEIQNRIATFCDTNNEITYEVMNPFDMAIVCSCFFKGGIRIESEKSLSRISHTLCTFLQQTLQDPSQHFNPFVIISLLKILRQVNFIDAKLLRLLSELIFHPLCQEKVRDNRFIINVAAAFSFPGCQNIHPSPNSRSDLSIEKILKRFDDLILNILLEEHSGISRRKSSDSVSVTTSTSVEKDPEFESTMVVKSRLKDISHWLWITASLGYQLCPEIYLKDLSQRLDKGQFTRNPSDAVDALLAQSIMNQYPDSIVLKILQSADFRSSVKVNCSNRHKGRLGLFLTSLRIERNSLLDQLSPRDEHQWFEAVRTPFTMTESNAWSSSHRKVKPLRVPGIKSDFKPHTQLLNECMDGLNRIFSLDSTFTSTGVYVGKLRDDDKENCNKVASPSISSTNSSLSAKLSALLLESKMNVPYQSRKAQIFVGYAVPFLFIPGLKIVFPVAVTRKEVFVEVLDDVGLSSTYHSFKMRLMAKMNHTYITISRAEIQDLDSVEIAKLLEARIKIIVA